MPPDPAVSGEPRAAPPVVIKAPLNGRGGINYWIGRAINMYFLRSPYVSNVASRSEKERTARVSHHPCPQGAYKLVRKLALTFRKRGKIAC